MAITGAKPRRLMHPWLIGASFAAAVGLSILPSAFANAHPAFNTLQTAFAIVTIPCLIAYVAQNAASLATRILKHRVLRFFGAISYSLYLIDGSIAMALKPSWPVFATGPTWLSFAMSRQSAQDATMPNGAPGAPRDGGHL